MAQIGMSDGDVARQIAAQGLLLVDWAQTREISRNPAFAEANVFLGPDPSITAVNRYFAIVSAIHWAVTLHLEGEQRKTWQNVTITIGALNTYRNHSYGVKMDFPF